MTADGQPACTPAPTVTTPDDRLDGEVAVALTTLLGRRKVLKVAAGGLAALMVAACRAAPNGSPTASASPPPSSSTSSPRSTASAEGKASTVYVFNVGSQDVSIIDTATNKVTATRPLGAAVRWLSNEQRYWDGTNIWTYDFPGNKVQAIAIDPKSVKVVKTIDTGTKGPGHSLMLTPDKKTALVNAAGSDVINVIDVSAGKVTDKIETGKFP